MRAIPRRIRGLLTQRAVATRPRMIALAAGCVLLFTLTMLTGTYFARTGRSLFRDAGGFLGSAMGLRQPFGGQSQVNILLVGVDETFGPGPSDTIIVLTVRPKDRYAALLSLPRDLYVRSRDGRGHKLNAMYSYGGVERLREVVGGILGVPIDHYLKLNTKGFEAIVDAAGGVEIDVDRRMRYRTSYMLIDLQPGRQLLDGEKALQYVRWRSDALSDIGRMRRQQQLLRDLSRQLLTPARAARIPQVITTALQYVETDLEAGDLHALAALAERVDLESAPTATLPAVPRDMRGISYLVTDPSWVQETVAYLFYRQPVRVQVLNGTGTERLAARVAELLQRNGIPVEAVDNAPYVAARTRIIDRGGIHGATVQTIARLLQTNEVGVTLEGGMPWGVQVVLGPDAESRVESD